mmetsp:Transcript_33115/g.107093  ORF Transcript_33115/g.107093 Transcript_33115/m.107093 type:complete len:264 (+) Transcript_33115:658-1449(+)
MLGVAPLAKEDLVLRRQELAEGPGVLVQPAGEWAELLVRLRVDKVRAVLCTYLVGGGERDAQVGAIHLLLGGDGRAAIKKTGGLGGVHHEVVTRHAARVQDVPCARELEESGGGHDDRLRTPLAQQSSNGPGAVDGMHSGEALGHRRRPQRLRHRLDCRPTPPVAYGRVSCTAGDAPDALLLVGDEVDGHRALRVEAALEEACAVLRLDIAPIRHHPRSLNFERRHKLILEVRSATELVLGDDAPGLAARSKGSAEGALSRAG